MAGIFLDPDEAFLKYLEEHLSVEEMEDIHEILGFEKEFGLGEPLEDDFSPTSLVPEEIFRDELENWGQRHPDETLSEDPVEAVEQILTALLHDKLSEESEK